MISFATGDCEKAPNGWRVAKGTVTTIILSPQIPMTPAMFGIDLSKYKKQEDGEIVGIDHYTNEEEGVTVDMYAGVIQNLYLYPRKADEAMRCQPQGKTETKPEGGEPLIRQITSITLVTSTVIPVSFHASRREPLILLAEISNFTGREGNDVREAPHHSPR